MLLQAGDQVRSEPPGQGWRGCADFCSGLCRIPSVVHLLMCQASSKALSVILFNFGWRIVKEVLPAPGWGRARWSDRVSRVPEVGKPRVDFEKMSLDV